MKSLQERIAWYERHFPEMAEQGLIRFHDSNVPEGDKAARQNFAGDLNKISSDSVITKLDTKENKRRNALGHYLVSDVYLSGTSAFQKDLTTQFNFSSSPDFSQNIENDFTFFHELAHKIHMTKDEVFEEGAWLLTAPNKLDIFSDDSTEEKTTKLYLYSECIADAFATLMTILEHGFTKGIGFANLVSDARLLAMTNDMRHMTALTIDDCIEEATGNGDQLSKYKDKGISPYIFIKASRPENIFHIAQAIANKNPMFAELQETGQSLKDKSLEIREELEIDQKPLKQVNSMSQRLKNRFHQAIHRRISIIKTLGNKANYEEKIYDGPWADPNAKFLHAKDRFTTNLQDINTKQLKRTSRLIRIAGMILFRETRKGFMLNNKPELDETACLMHKKHFTKSKKTRSLWEKISQYVSEFFPFTNRKAAMHLLTRSEMIAQAILVNEPATKANRLSRMNGRKSKEQKPS